MKPTLENMEELLNHACNSGGSGEGISHYAVANRCGMRAHLSLERAKADKAEGTQRSQPSEGRVDSRRVGSAYHQLHEWWSEGALDALPGFMALSFEDPSFTQAVQLFDAYLQTYPKRYWGRTLHSEWLLPESDEKRLENKMVFSGATFNAKPDRVVHTSESDIKEITRCQLDGPGVYIIDFKTSGMDHTPKYWSESLQALWYPWAVQMERPEWDVKGLIFDVIRKPRRKSDSVSFEAIYVPKRPYSEMLELIYPFVKGGTTKILEAQRFKIGTISECMSVGFGGDQICPYHGAECTFTQRSA